jgi:hypothetical protein
MADKTYSITTTGTGREDYTKATEDDSVVSAISTSTANLTAVVNALMVSTINVSVAAQTLSEAKVNVSAQDLSYLNVNLGAATVSNVNMNLVSQSSDLQIVLTDQTAGLSLTTDWATNKGKDFHLQGAIASLAAGASDTLITITLLETSEHWLYTVHVSGTKDGYCEILANTSGGDDFLAGGYFGSYGSGFTHKWDPPTQRRKDSSAGTTEITVKVTNKDASTTGDFVATLEGIRIPDEGTDEVYYTTEADWGACSEQYQISTTESPGDVVLDRNP